MTLLNCSWRRVILASLFSLSLILFPLVSHAINVESVPNPRAQSGGWVSDVANILSAETESQLNQMIGELEAENGTEIAVVTVPETQPYSSPKEFTTTLFNHWEIGKAEKDNGMLFLVSVGDRRVEIETGYGLEPILPDAKVGEILETYILPYFKDNDFDTGILRGTQALITAVRQPDVATPLLIHDDGGWLKWEIFYLVLPTALLGVVTYQRAKTLAAPNPISIFSLMPRRRVQLYHSLACSSKSKISRLLWFSCFFGLITVLSTIFWILAQVDISWFGLAVMSTVPVLILLKNIFFLRSTKDWIHLIGNLILVTWFSIFALTGFLSLFPASSSHLFFLVLSSAILISFIASFRYDFYKSSSGSSSDSGSHGGYGGYGGYGSYSGGGSSGGGSFGGGSSGGGGAGGDF